MSHSSSKTQFIHPGCYAIITKEEISDKWVGWFDEYTITRTESGETLLVGPISDQAALHGLLAKIRDLNLTLISVNLIVSKEKQS